MSTETTNKKIKIDNGTTFGRTYTDKAVDAKLPTDLIASANKLSLGVGNSTLGNGVNLDGFTYDETTKTLKASGGGKLPDGSPSDPFNLNMEQITVYATEFGGSSLYINNYSSNKFNIRFVTKSTDERLLSLIAYNPSKDREVSLTMYRSESKYILYHYLTPPNDNKNEYHILEIAKKTIDSLADGDYSLSIKVANKKFYCIANQGGSPLKNTYNHYIVISDGTSSNAIYLLIPSTNNLKCNSLTDIDTLLGTAQRFIQASGVVTGTTSKLPIIALNWQGSIATSKVMTMSSEEVINKFTNVVDVITPA